MIIDDDHAGMFVFEDDERTVIESDREVEIKVLRTSGARGRIRVPFRTEDETAINERDYMAKAGEVIFENNENEYVEPKGLTSDQHLTIRFARLANIVSIESVLHERRTANCTIAKG